MSDYRRLISYIYAYEGGVKGKNIGYAKIEVRGGLCKVQVSVKKVFVGSNETGVYLLAPGAEILLGRIFIRNGSGEFRGQVDAADVEGTGIGVDACYGLTIHDVAGAWQCYTTIWEDAVAQTAQLQLAEITAENMRKKETQESADSCPEQPEPEAAQLMPAEKTAEELMAARLPVSEQIERELEAEQQRLETIAPWAQNAETSAEPEEEKKKISEPEIPDGGAPEPEDPERLRELDILEAEGSRRGELWNRLQQYYTKVLAFEYDNGCEILSIKPQDIGLLPREIWVYGNNSFLLHGYYNYRHLILARLSSPQGPPRYLLGVPGHYFSNEKHMAAMFGFPHFVLAKKQPDEDGRFGYWYTDIRL